MGKVVREIGKKKDRERERERGREMERGYKLINRHWDGHRQCTAVVLLW